MSKKCEHCGSELGENDKVCPNCGAVVEQKVAKKDVKNATTSTNSSPIDEAEKKSNKNVAIIGGVVVVAIIVIIIVFALISGAYKSPIKNYFNGMQKASSKTYLKAFPSFMQDELEKSYDDDRMEEMMESYEKKYGDKVKITYKILDKTKLEKDELDDVKDDLKDEYEDEKIKVTKGYEVCIKATIKGSDEEEVDYTSLKIYNINGKWCLIDA